MKRIVISWDLDGVLYDFYTEITKVIRESIPDFEPDLSDWSLGMGESFRPFYVDFVERGLFRWGNPLVDPARIRALRDEGVTNIYVTARREAARPETQAWLDEHGFPGALYMSDWKGLPTVLFNHNETTIYGIDDSGKNVEAMEAAGMVPFLVDYEHNRGTQARRPDIATVPDATAFCDMMGALLAVKGRDY